MLVLEEILYGIGSDRLQKLSRGCVETMIKTLVRDHHKTQVELDNQQRLLANQAAAAPEVKHIMITRSRVNK